MAASLTRPRGVVLLLEAEWAVRTDSSTIQLQEIWIELKNSP